MAQTYKVLYGVDEIKWQKRHDIKYMLRYPLYCRVTVKPSILYIPTLSSSREVDDNIKVREPENMSASNSYNECMHAIDGSLF